MSTLAPKFATYLAPLLRSLGVGIVVCGAIAVFFTFAFDNDFGPVLVVSLSIGLTCQLLIDGGRRLLARWLLRWHPTTPPCAAAGPAGAGPCRWSWSRARLAVSEAQVQAAQRAAAESRLKLLESQLEPHMLFNTLANLRLLIALDAPRAQAMLDHLIAFLRASSTPAAPACTRWPTSSRASRITWP